MESKSLSNTNTKDAQATTPDIKVVGNPDDWKLLMKASSEKQGWMKSTKVMKVSTVGCLVQVTSEFREPSNGRVVATAEALVFCPGTMLRDFNFPKEG